ncbi:undecaprenyldiphospho-muramoylpentapeptide beta-N-acetylglucosaminyltransferase [Psychrobium sp. 1_MG-2023]|uniref:undecaprenyldiphospho-muramoylpentapeptide beta-N-acetylglucosaminyltransferase n=1 Tax=Psychrobium sp. 1_MG-2023 TaxID=3062624 RepID=UPI000C328CB2|nr:undecaprenyldiphospho-muramoylpentapeptide beta-N-acetylglucosaminyltransferase [Psychrobium sp. 1_MG-2023]MDP2561462.1 undecaprenyldiphospho-muramoylpentapeptide beta-N-acetylglucosaminyltransferase [Psychrobium sp. 1_MG-2023]PKF57729.1 undecaprenyldiphospho-muramoylpentapeptide beta-N-acetylglucosaminyltransferase [Alteromonadales bacterium alter-6D02]
MSKRLLVMAGGTGGHVFPGLAVVNLLREQGWEIHWLGCATRMEAQLVPQHNIDISFIDVEGVRGNGIVRLIKAPFKLLRSVWQARAVIKEYQPDVVLGMGGFASGPGGIAAKLCQLPLVLHEQNAIAGMTNRYLAKMADAVMVAFDGALAEASPHVVGNPVRADIISLGAQSKQVDVAKSQFNVLVVGGSLGAKVLNETMPQACQHLSELNIHIRHQAGKGNSQVLKDAYQGIEHIQVSDFIDDMADAYQWADLVVCRAGALTVSEIAVLGLPAIFVPLPYAVDDHQTKNAQALTQVGAAKLLPQSEMTAESLAQQIQQILSPEQLILMSRASKGVAKLDATEQVALMCAKLAGDDYHALAQRLEKNFRLTEVERVEQ